MINKRKIFGSACRTAALTFLVTGSASLLQAQQTPPVATAPQAPILFASNSALADLSSSSSSSSSSDSGMSSDGRFTLDLASLDGKQPPPRRRYGRPNYSDSHSNPDGSPKWAILAGGGMSLPIVNTHKYDTPGWAFQVGAGRNFSKSTAVILQFDYDHFGLQGATLANQSALYDYYCTPSDQANGFCSPVTGSLDGSSHVWSFTLNPTFTIPTEGNMGAYFVVGGGYYHKVTDFTVPSTGGYCDQYGYCYQYTSNQIIDHYTSNAGGVNGGFGLTYKFSKFSNERFYAEARYVLVFDPQRYGITAASSRATLNSYAGYDYYPQNSNRTTYIPIKVGIRF